MISIPDKTLPPASLECEMAVIGAMLTCQDRLDLFAEIRAPLTARSFLQADHAIMFTVLCEMVAAGRKVDGVLFTEELSRRQQLQDVGGYEYLADILRAVPTPQHGVEYAKKVADAAAWRELIGLCDRIKDRAYRPYKFEGATQAARELSEQAIQIATTGCVDSIVTLGDAANDVLRRKAEPTVRCIPTGIKSLDFKIGGLPKGKFTLVAADPRVGKSQLIKQIGLNLANRGVRFGLVSIEEDREKVAENMLANSSGIENNKIAFGTLSEPEWNEVERSAAQLGTLPFFIEDTMEEIGDICIAIQRLVYKHKCDVIAVDHVHLIESAGETREREIGKITEALKKEFKRLKVPGLAAAQLNRGANTAEMPTLRNLRGSGSLEADADVVLLLWREDLAKQYEQNHTPNHRLTVIIAKNKSGEMGEVHLEVSGATQRISDMKDPFGNGNQDVSEYGL